MKVLSRVFVGLFSCAVIAFIPAAPLAMRAAPTPAPEKLKPLSYVPADATLFVHVEAGEFFASEIGKPIFAAKDKAPQLKKMLGELKKLTGLELEQVQTFTVYWLQFKDPNDFSKFGMIATLRDPFDLPAFTKRAKELSKGKGEFEEGKDFLKITNDKSKEYYRVDCSVPRQVIVLANVDEKYAKPQPADAKGPLSPQIALAAEGNVFTAAVNMLNLPDDIRADNLPVFVQPFMPILKSEVMSLSGRLNKGNLVLTLTATAKDRAAAGEVEKSYDAGRKFFLAGIEDAKKELAKELEKSEEMDLKPFPDLLKLITNVLTDGTISSDGNRASATLTIPGKTDLGPAVELAFGGRISKNAVQQNNLKQFGLAMHAYHDTYGMLPPAANIDKKGQPLLSWRVAILPFIEQQALYEKFKLDEPWDSEHNKKVMEDNPMPAVFAVPGNEDEKLKDTHCQVFTGTGAFFEAGQAIKFANVTDGLSNTAMVALAAKAVPWTKPDDMEFDAKKDPRTLLLFINGGTNVAFGDGSVRLLKKTLAEETWKAIITRAGGEVVNLDE